MNSLKDYLKELPETPLSLSIKTKIIVEGSRKQEIHNVMLSRTDKISKLYGIVSQFYKGLGDPVLSFEQCIFKVKRNRLDLDINGQLKEEDSSIAFTNKEDIFMSYDIITGEDIYLIGNLLLESDAPKNCISYNFKEPITLDYFTCETCNKNWICNECVKACHKNHKILMFKKQHTTTWACCYCFKANLSDCKLKNKMSQA